MCHPTQPMITPTNLSGRWLMCHPIQPMITPTKSEWLLVDVSSYTANDYTN